MIYRLTKRAKADIQSIDRHTVREFGFLQADLYIGGLDSLLELLCEYPEMGQTIHGDRRSFPYRKHIILYRVLSEEIRVIRIWDARRLMPKGWEKP